MSQAVKYQAQTYDKEFEATATEARVLGGDIYIDYTKLSKEHLPAAAVRRAQDISMLKKSTTAPGKSFDGDIGDDIN
jgi:hypothetical protein